MPGRAPKAKGSAFERELVNAFTATGITAERAWGSNGKALGHAETVDLTANGCRIQAKRRKAVPAWLTIPDGADAVAVREDRGETVILLRLSDFVRLIKEGW